MDSTIYFTKQFIEFGKNSLGLIHKPYQTERKIALSKPFYQLIFIAGLIALYLFLATLAKDSLVTNPLFLTKSVFSVGFAISFTYFLVTSLIYTFAKFFNSEGDLRIFMLLWAFSLIPTLAWFLITTIFYVLLPPPRTLSLAGQFFSGLFMVFSFACFFWKGILYYLALRIGLHLGAIKIFLMSFVIFPVGFVFAYVLHRLGIFGVPFI